MSYAKRLLLPLVLALCPFALVAQDQIRGFHVYGEIRQSGYPLPLPDLTELAAPELDFLDTSREKVEGEFGSFEISLEIPVEHYDELRKDFPHWPPPEQVQSHQSAASVSVGSYSCNIQAHNPHKGRFSGTVKAKASGTCEFVPNWSDWPPNPWSTLWILRMRLISTSGVVGYSSHWKLGWEVEWEPDSVLAAHRWTRAVVSTMST